MNSTLWDVAVPDRMKFSFDDDAIEYEEVYMADDANLAESVADTTEELAKLYARRLEDDGGDEIAVEVDTEVNDEYVVVNVKITPGKPEGAENLAMAAIGGEIMGTLAVSDPTMWKVIVKATESSAEDMLESIREAVRDAEQ